MGPNRIFVDLEQSFQGYSIPVVRYDWVGMGDSEGAIASTTLGDAVAQLISVHAYARNFYPKASPVFIAHSLGVPVLLEMAKEVGLSDAQLILLAPGPFDHETMKLVCPNYLDGRVVERKGLLLSGDFLSDVVNRNWYDRLEEARCETLALAAKDDPYCCVETLSHLVNPRYRFVALPSGRHNFTSTAAKKDLPDKIIDFLSIESPVK
jgi:pimeloyl-ACP methyl ester carboxylesterase